MNAWNWYTVTLRVEWRMSMSDTIDGDLIVRANGETPGHAIGRVIQSLPRGLTVRDSKAEETEA